MRLSLLSALAAAAVSVSALPNAEKCAPVHIIVARGSTEPQGYGLLENVITPLKKKIPGANSEALVYPALLEGYEGSFATGVKVITERLKAYTAACKDSKIVLFGYSQGAHIQEDALCGVGGGSLGPKSPPTLGPEVSKRIAAIVWMGNPRFMVGQPYDVGTSKNSGAFERDKDQMCPPDIGAKIQSYCDKDDVFCAGGSSLSVHLSYMDKYRSKANKFVLKKLGL